MSENLLDAINELITPGLLGQAAGALGEPEAALSKGMGAVLPLLLGGVASRAALRSGIGHAGQQT